MTFKFFASLFLILCCLTPISEVSYSRGKQQKYFPKELQKKNVFLGMSLEKLRKKCPLAKPIENTSEFKIEFSEKASIPGIVGYTYLLTQTAEPHLYQIIIEYNSMEGVHERAVQIMGVPNYKGEWRIEAKDIKEDFAMGAWTFGHKLSYGATLKDTEWEKGFQN